jgi:energy-converting hydrogenase A subunit M
MDSDEFEDLLSRNNSVSTAAIRRAVEDAARGCLNSLYQNITVF